MRHLTVMSRPRAAQLPPIQTILEFFSFLLSFVQLIDLINRLVGKEQGTS